MRASRVRLAAALLLALGAAAAPAQTRAGFEQRPAPQPPAPQEPAPQPPAPRQAPAAREAQPPATSEPLPPVPHIPGLTPSAPAPQPQQRPQPRTAQPPAPAPAPADEGAGGDFAPPALRTHVTDEAGVLQPQERRDLEARLTQLRQESGVQVAVYLPASLQGRTVEDVAYETFNAWGLGEREADNGVLLLIAPRERRVRIETGKGVGGELPDALAGRIIRESITPRLQAGDWAGGILAGADGIARALTGRGLPEGQLPQQPRGTGGGGPQQVPVVGCGGSPMLCILFSLFGLFMLSRIFRGPRGPRGRRRGGIVFIPPIFGGGGGWHGGGGGGSDGGGFSGGGGESGGGGASGRW